MFNRIFPIIAFIVASAFLNAYATDTDTVAVPTQKNNWGAKLIKSPFGLGLDLQTKYVWRGMEMMTEKSAPVLFPSVNYSWKGLHIYFMGGYAVNGRYAEVDAGISYTLSDFTLGIYDYYYPTVSGKKDKYMGGGRHTVHWLEACFTYAPSKTVAGSMINFNKENTGMPSVTFIPLTHDVSDQVDMCMAQPVLNVTKQIGPVPADLYHTLTQVWFDMNYKGTLPDPNYYVLIDQISIRNIIGCKKCYYAMSAPYYEWQPDSECTADSTYVVSRFTHNELKSGYFTPGIWEYDSLPLETDGVFVPVQNSFGRLYLIPQHIETSTIISITYGFYVKVLDNYVAVASFTKELPMPAAMDWEPNRVVRYKITLDIGLSQPVVTGYVIDDWQSSGNVHSEIFFD